MPCVVDGSGSGGLKRWRKYTTAVEQMGEKIESHLPARSCSTRFAQQPMPLAAISNGEDVYYSNVAEGDATSEESEDSELSGDIISLVRANDESSSR